MTDNVDAAIVADKLFTAKLITKSVRGEASVSCVVNYMRMRPLITAVHSQIDLNTNNYYEFLGILKSISGLESVVSLLPEGMCM